MGTLGRSPLENTHSEVAAVPNQDVFAVGVDLCFILAHPSKKGEDINMWTHSVRSAYTRGWRRVGRAVTAGAEGRALLNERRYGAK